MIGALQFIPHGHIENAMAIIRAKIVELDCSVEVKNKHHDLLSYYKFDK